jgi:hypothetical protein
VAYNARLPSGLEVPAVLHRGAEGGGGSNRRGKVGTILALAWKLLLWLRVRSDICDCLKQVITRPQFSSVR